MIGASVDIHALNDLENGIHSFDRQMAGAKNEIEHLVNLYFQDFERGLRILEDRLRKAEEDLERAEIALERQRNKRVWVKDKDGEGHWERADCFAEEARVARCQAVCNRCRRDVNECRDMISDARSKRHIQDGKYSLFQSQVSEAIDRMRPIKEVVERHQSLQPPSSFSAGSGTRSFPSSSSSASSSVSAAASISRGADLSRPRPPMTPGTTYGPKASPLTERPRSPQNERVNPAPSRPITEADRPRSPFGDGGRVTRDSVSSFWEGLGKIVDKHKDDKTDE